VLKDIQLAEGVWKQNILKKFRQNYDIEEYHDTSFQRGMADM
jgi:hypothetical protein